jgi:predicted dehydrogenase
MTNTTDISPLRLGFIGGSRVSAVGYAHFVACTMDNRWSLEAGCFTPDRAIGERTALAYGVPLERTYTDWRPFIERERSRLDAVVVLTPTPMHFEMVKVSLEAGLPVICEKSMALDAAQGEALLETTREHSGFLAVTYNYSGYPMVRELRALIKNGRLGRIIHFQAEMPQEGFIRLDALGNRPQPQRWRLSDAKIPTIHLDLGVHLHHLVHYLTAARPHRVAASQASYGWFPEIIDNVSAVCEYSKGIVGQLWFSKSALGHRNGLRLRIFGTEAAAEWFQADPEELRISYADGRREIIDRAGAVEVAACDRYSRFKAGHPAGFIEAFANLYGDLADCLRQFQQDGTWSSPEVSGAELAVEGLHFLEAMAQAATTGEWQAVPLAPPPNRSERGG